ncbi:MAG: haloacid dehalogenase-like hydrolase [Deltaproteobacteria bacterium]|nr:haloacid dehalogenase-like hydrolase [Deltaproteobacteria bacterium]
MARTFTRSRFAAPRLGWLLVVLWLLGALAWAGCAGPTPTGPEPAPPTLSSWQDGPAKEAIRKLVEQVSRPGSPTYLPPAARVAVFDNDGTLWIEKPQYIPTLFEFDHILRRAAAEPALREQEPYRAVLNHDFKSLLHRPVLDIVKMFYATHDGQTQAAYEQEVDQFFRTARHPRYKRSYLDLTYLPMVELLSFLTAHEFQVYIVTGGEVDFVRAVSPQIYGIPVDRVAGSYVAYQYQETDGGQIVRGGLVSFNVEAAKPANIQLFIGQRPVLAFGNSDGDLEMLAYTAGRKGPSLSLLLLHDDAAREYAYQKGAEKALDTARERGWSVVSMKNDFRKVFAFEP